MKIDSRKEGRYLVFNLEGGQKGSVKYDLATKQYIGKKGKPVNNLCSQFRGYSIDEVIGSFEDEAYKKFLFHVYNNSLSRGAYYSNVGTFLTKVADYGNYEQFFTAGITKVNVSPSTTISDIPRGLLKICKENPGKMPLEQRLLDNYKSHTDLFNLMYSLKDEYELFDITRLMYESTGYRWNTSSLDKILHLIKDYNYNPKALFKYIDNIMVYEGISQYSEVMINLYDYVTMSQKISNKFEKYPRYLKTTHDITVRNYNRLKEVFEEEDFKKVMNKEMEFTYKEYVFLYPNSTIEIKEEAVQQSNCVASYIKRVLEGGCHIMFMRKKYAKEESLVTLEVSTHSYQVVQQKGRYNRDTTAEEKEAIEKFNKHLNHIKRLYKEEGDK